MTAAILRFLALLWIEIKRCQGIFLAVPLAALVINRYEIQRGREGVVLWRDVSINVAESSYITASIGAGFAVWVLGRSRRRRTEQLEATVPAPAGRASLVSMLAVQCWMLAVHLAVFAWFGTQAMREATWGGPDLRLVAIGALLITASVGFGAIVGSFGRPLLLAPLVVIVIFAGNVYAADALEYEKWTSLVPLAFLSEANIPLGFSLPAAAIWSMLGWLAAGTMVLGAVVLLARQRTVLRWVVVIITAIATLIGANRVMAEHEILGSSESLVVNDAVEPECRQGEMVTVCVHPGYSSLLDELVVAADATYRPVMGLTGVPDRLVSNDLVPTRVTGQDGAFGILWDRTTIGMVIDDPLEALFLGVTGDWGKAGPEPSFGVRDFMTATQCVVINALSQDAHGHWCIDGLIAEEATIGAGVNGPLPESGWTPRMEAKIATFEALSPEQQREWLEANWDALVAGDLALEDLP